MVLTVATTELTVIETVATLLSLTPLFALNWKLSGPV